MSTYLNCYELFSEVREAINEFTTAYVQGTDTTGAYRNADIFKKVNDAQEFIFESLLNRDPSLFYKSTALTGSSSLYTLPADFYRLRRVEDSAGRKLTRQTIDQRHQFLSEGSSFQYYPYGKSLTTGMPVIKLDKDGSSDILTFYYVARCRKIHSGMSSAGGALSLTLEAPTARKEADYYNGMRIENVTDDWVDVISAYTAARVATLAAQTGAASKYYGLISELPEIFHSLIGPKAILLMKQAHKSLKPPTQQELKDFDEFMGEKFRAFFGTAETDVDMMELFL